MSCASLCLTKHCAAFRYGAGSSRQCRGPRSPRVDSSAQRRYRCSRRTSSSAKRSMIPVGHQRYAALLDAQFFSIAQLEMPRNQAPSFEHHDSTSALSAAVLSERGRIGIIGAGVVGLSCAIHLQRLGYRVEMLDPRNPGEGASLGNAGIIAVSEVFPLARSATLRQVPRMLFDPIGPLAVRYRYAPFIAPWLVRFVAASRPAEVRRITGALASLLAPA